MRHRVLISGAGSGIGQAMALRLATYYDLVLLGRNSQRLEGTLGQLPGGQHQILSCDVCSQEQLRAGLQSLKQPELYAVVANAGIGGENHYGDEDRFDQILQINLKGVYNLVNECLPYLKNSSSKFRHIAITSSVLANLGVPGYSAYCASKAAVLGLMRSWAAEFAPHSILVNAICPGWVETDMAREGLENFAQKIGKNYEQAYQMQMSLVPLKKTAQPSELGHLLNYLISPEQTSITGQTLHINNGAMMF